MDEVTLGALIRRARHERGIGMRELAERLAQPHSWLSKIETGTRAVRGTELLSIADALAMTVDELLLGGGSPSVAVARAVAVEAGESVSAAITNWVCAADRAVALTAEEAGLTGLPQEWAAAAAAAYLPAPRAVGVAPERAEAAAAALTALVRCVAITPLPLPPPQR